MSVVPLERQPSARTLVELVLSLVPAVPLAFGTVWLIGSAWAVCDEAEAGARFGLNTVILVFLMLAGWAAFSVALITLRKAHLLIRLACGAVLALAACLTVVTLEVPAYGEDFYGLERPRRDAPECGPEGIPTWWPDWLPS